MMVQLDVLALVCLVGSVKGAPPLPCCLEKSVGGVSYSLVKEADTSGYNCLANCVYQKDGDEDAGPVFCFAAGDLEVVCGDGGEFTEKPGGDGGEVTDMPGGDGGEVTDMPGGPDGQSPPVPGPAEGTCSYADEHTMNAYPGPAEVCGYELIFAGLNDIGKELILAKHNELRQKVASGGESGQPEAANMMKLVWNDELAEIAQRWADQCIFGHDEIRDMCDGTIVGQNAYIAESSEDDPEDVVMAAVPKAAQAWYNEVTAPGFSSANINPFVFNAGTGHYTQVAWAETSQIGCGMVYYETDDSWFAQLVICNYAMSGNLAGGEMYEVGTGCGNCPAGTSCDGIYGALCS